MTTAAPSRNGTQSLTDDFPVDSFRDAARHLRRPFTPAAVKFKPQSTTRDGSKTMCVAYIDARLVVERLNLVCPHLWRDAYEPTPNGLMWCHLTVDGITRSDVGEGKGKALVSDALKRAAVRFGIGVSLYAVPQAWLPGKVEALYPYMSEYATLRTRYEQWLGQSGVKAFGEPLDHGDVEDAQGDTDADRQPAPAATPTEPESAPAPQITAKRAKDIVDAAWHLNLGDKLQLAASHAYGHDIGDCSTKSKAQEALRKLTAAHAVKVEQWIARKAGEREQPSPTTGPEASA